MGDLKFTDVRELVRGSGHAWFESAARPYNLNIVGVRGKDAKLDEFGCSLTVSWPEGGGRWQFRSWRITTFPGRRYLVERLLNPRGCAILVPGQYRGAYGVRKHRGQYDALCQMHGAVRVFRDGNRDEEFDMRPSTIMRGWFGINVHRSVRTGRAWRVGAHSAGCQVFERAADFAEFMAIVKEARRHWGNRFTYTLVEEG